VSIISYWLGAGIVDIVCRNSCGLYSRFFTHAQCFFGFDLLLVDNFVWILHEECTSFCKEVRGESSPFRFCVGACLFLIMSLLRRLWWVQFECLLFMSLILWLPLQNWVSGSLGFMLNFFTIDRIYSKSQVSMLSLWMWELNQRIEPKQRILFASL